MNSISQSPRSVIAAVALGALVPASSTDGFESVVVVPPKRDVEARLGQYREFQRSDGIRLLGLRDSLNHVCLVVAPVEGPFIRVAHAREIVDGVIRDLRIHPVVAIPESEAQLLSDVAKRLCGINEEHRSIEGCRWQAAQLVATAQAEHVPDWLLHSCRQMAARASCVFERWRVGDEWQTELRQIEEEYRLRKKFVGVWSEVQASLAQVASFSHPEDERLSQRLRESLESLTREAKSLEAALRIGPGGESIQRWAEVQRINAAPAAELHDIYYRLGNDAVYRAQAYQAGRFESMASTVTNGVYVVVWGAIFVIGAMVVDSVRQGRERGARLLSPRHRKPRELTVEERSRIVSRW